MIRRTAALAAAGLIIAACTQQAPSGPQALPKTDFLKPTATSGCPSEACSAILNLVAEGATTDVVPPDLKPTLQDAKTDMYPPEGGDCAELPVADLEPRDQPCTFNGTDDPVAPMMILIGNSRGLMWSQALSEIASRNGFRFGLVYKAGCHIPVLENPPNAPNVSKKECDEWRSAAVNWVNQQNPAMVLVASGPEVNDEVTETEQTMGYAQIINQLQAPARKVFVLGEVPRPVEDPDRCLAAHTTSALACATNTKTSDAVQRFQQQADFDAAQQAGASYVNLSPWLCTAELCPAIIGRYLPYQNRYHLTTTYTKALIPVMQQVLGL